MAERSIGMTTGTGDGVVGGYDSDRMINFWSKSLGNGILLTGNKFNISGTSTASMVVATGACINNGFFYENTTNLTLVMTGVANGTYYLVVRLNNTASAVTVVRTEGTGATTTTIAARTCRLALVTTVSYDQTTDILIASCIVSGGILSSFSYEFRQVLAKTSQLATQVYSAFTSTTTTVANITWTQFANNTAFNTDSRILSMGVSGANPQITITEPGAYLWDVYIGWDTNTTGSRGIYIATAVSPSPSDPLQPQFITAAAASVPTLSNSPITRWVFTTYFPAPFSVTNSCQLYIYQNSGASRTCSGNIKITRL